MLEQMRWQEWCNRRATPVTDMENLDEMAIFCAFGNKKRTKVPNKEDCRDECTTELQKVLVPYRKLTDSTGFR